MEDSQRPRIALIDDDAEVRRLVSAGLVERDFDVRSADDGEGGIALARSWKPDAVVLDVVLPGLDGMAVLGRLRAFTQVPIVLVSALGDVTDRVAGLNAGADDFVPKPFDLDELAARLRSALRRPRLEHADVVRFADLELDLELRSARRNGRRIDLSTREYTLLMTLLRRPRRVFSKGELAELVWGADRAIAPNTVETYISYLRAKVDRPPEPPLIRTIRGVGYTLSAGE
jgi:DNA-binding response OmpR family regulator